MRCALKVFDEIRRKYPEASFAEVVSYRLVNELNCGFSPLCSFRHLRQTLGRVKDEKMHCPRLNLLAVPRLDVRGVGCPAVYSKVHFLRCQRSLSIQDPLEYLDQVRVFPNASLQNIAEQVIQSVGYFVQTCLESTDIPAIGVLV
jgi:hypothetical protein